MKTAAIARNGRALPGESGDPGNDHNHRSPGPVPGWLSPMLAILEEHAGFPFHPFRKRPLVQALAQESHIAQFRTPREYLVWLRSHPAEAKKLALRLLNRTTRFFRDPEAFAFLKERVLRPLLQSRSGRVRLRIWVAGCATGEEAYSIAICAAECLEETGIAVPVRIFATDLNPLVLRKARTGIYPARAVAQVSPDRIARFFQKQDGEYQISRPIRDLCRFARQDLVADRALYGRLDLVSCRNVLMYLTRPARRRVLEEFHRSLRPGGILMLGTAEWTNGHPVFRQIDPVQRFFRKVPVSGL